MKVSCLIIIALFASVAAAAAAAAAAAIGDEQLPHDEPVAAKNGEQCVKSTDCSETSYCSNVRNIVARAGEVDAKPVEGICVAKVGINLPCFASVECLGYPNTKAESKSSITGNDYVNKEQFEADVLAHSILLCPPPPPPVANGNGSSGRDKSNSDRAPTAIFCKLPPGVLQLLGSTKAPPSSVTIRLSDKAAKSNQSVLTIDGRQFRIDAFTPGHSGVYREESAGTASADREPWKPIAKALQRQLKVVPSNEPATVSSKKQSLQQQHQQQQHQQHQQQQHTQTLAEAPPMGRIRRPSDGPSETMSKSTAKLDLSALGIEQPSQPASGRRPRASSRAGTTAAQQNQQNQQNAGNEEPSQAISPLLSTKHRHDQPAPLPTSSKVRPKPVPIVSGSPRLKPDQLQLHQLHYQQHNQNQQHPATPRIGRMPVTPLKDSNRPSLPPNSNRQSNITHSPPVVAAGGIGSISAALTASANDIKSGRLSTKNSDERLPRGQRRRRDDSGLDLLTLPGDDLRQSSRAASATRAASVRRGGAKISTTPSELASDDHIPQLSLSSSASQISDDEASSSPLSAGGDVDFNNEDVRMQVWRKYDRKYRLHGTLTKKIEALRHQLAKVIEEYDTHAQQGAKSDSFGTYDAARASERGIRKLQKVERLEKRLFGIHEQLIAFEAALPNSVSS
ncbi:hypothetical protein GQ42DRAFT_157626 [Ramicandelaber brevisporus]|nr:hypothetical protein GQ42DRAFT_157626 [Ramicandelaber brevisporus]